MLPAASIIEHVTVRVHLCQWIDGSASCSPVNGFAVVHGTKFEVV